MPKKASKPATPQSIPEPNTLENKEEISDILIAISVLTRSLAERIRESARDPENNISKTIVEKKSSEPIRDATNTTINETTESTEPIVQEIEGDISSPEDIVEPDTSNLTTPPEPPTLTTVRQILANLSRAGHTEEVRLLLQKHGATKLSEIEPENYPALLADAAEISNT